MPRKGRKMEGLTVADFLLKEDSLAVKLLGEVENALGEHFEIVDWMGVEIIVAVTAAHYAPGEMLWFREIGASRSGKTELLRAISRHKDTAKMEALTPAALRGGLKEAPKMLKRIDGKLVVTKDLAPLLTKSRESRNEIFGLLRPIKDGELVADYGSSEGNLSQKVKFDWIVATTPVFEQYRQLESLLGERFIDMRWKPGDRAKMALKAGMNNPDLDGKIRPELATLVCALMDEASSVVPTIEISAKEMEIISGYADKTARLRTPVARDRDRHITIYPEPEIGTDLTQGFSRIVKGLKFLEIDFEPCLNRLLWDSMPKMRAIILTCVLNGVVEAEKIADITHIATNTVRYVLEDLRLLEIVDKNKHLLIQIHPSQQ